MNHLKKAMRLALSCCSRYLIALFLVVACAAAQAESLVSIESSQIATLGGDDSISRVLVVDDRPVAIGDRYTWVLDETEQRWERKDWRPLGNILGTAGDGLRVFLLLRSEYGAGATRVERISLLAGDLESSALPPLPVLRCGSVNGGGGGGRMSSTELCGAEGSRSSRGLVAELCGD